MKYRSIDWNDHDEELHELLAERCQAKLAACTLIDWNDLTRLAQDRIEQQCMREIEAAREESFADFEIDRIYG